MAVNGKQPLHIVAMFAGGGGKDCLFRKNVI